MLVSCALVLGIVALYFPDEKDDIVDATQFTVAFFATLLTGEAVIFALTFSAASAWPSLHAIDAHIAFREWVIIGWVAAMFTAGGLLGQSVRSATYGALLFLLTNVFGVFSFVQLFGLASMGGRNRLLRRTLTRGLIDLNGQRLPLDQMLSDAPVVAAYLSTIDQGVSNNDPTIDEARGLADPGVALGTLSRYPAWPSSTSMLMSVRGVGSIRAARELIAIRNCAPSSLRWLHPPSGPQRDSPRESRLERQLSPMPANPSSPA